MELVILLVLLTNVSQVCAGEDLRVFDHEQLQSIDYKTYRYDKFENYYYDYVRNDRIVYVSKFEGALSFIESKFNDISMRYYRKVVKSFYENNHLHDIDLNVKLAEYYTDLLLENSTIDNRQFYFDNYSVDNGGMSLGYQKYGDYNELSIIEPVRISNAGRVVIANWKIDVEQDDIFPTGRLQPITTNSYIRPDGYLLYFRSSAKRSKSYWSMSPVLKLDIKYDKWRGNKSSITVGAKINRLAGVKRYPILGINFKIRARPVINTYDCQIAISLLRW